MHVQGLSTRKNEEAHIEIDELKDGMISTFERSKSENSNEIEGDEGPHTKFDSYSSLLGGDVPELRSTRARKPVQKFCLVFTSISFCN